MVPTDDSTLDDTEDDEDAPAAPAPSPGERYQVRQQLGHGGMGDVVLVHDGLIGRDVALKQLRKHTPKTRRRFAREARIQGQLEHPAVAPVYDLGDTPEGNPFFTMKRVRGNSLRSVLTTETSLRLSRRRLLTAFSQVCLAVHYAHERGIVHRDIKPENIMLGDYGEVYLLDWGIAKIMGQPDQTEEGEETQVMTRAGELLGTVGYMAPEQSSGEREQVDARADVYSLGAVLFEILTLERLHPPAPVPTMIRQILEGVDARCSVRAPDRDVPPELERLCVLATRRDPGQRLQTARELHAAIELYLDGDRDFELRRTNAQLHARAAREAANAAMNATAEEAPARVEALQQIGKALTYDPGNRDALATLVRLLTHPPRAVPGDVQRARKTANLHHVRRAAMLGAFVYLYALLNVFIMYASTIRSWSGFMPAQLLWLAAVLASAATVWRPRYEGLFVMLTLGVAGTVETTRILSPLLIVPAMLAAHAVIYNLMDDWRRRAAVLGLCVVGWTISAFFYPSMVTLESGKLIIDSPVVDLARVFTPGMTWLIFVALILLPAVVVGAMRDAYGRADLQLRLQTWQLSQMLPDPASRPLD
jgi:serine/threonine-protein kinase